MRFGLPLNKFIEKCLSSNIAHNTCLDAEDVRMHLMPELLN